MPRSSRFAPLLVLPLILAGCAAAHDGVEPAAFASTACGTWVADDHAEALSKTETISSLSGSVEERSAQAIALAEGAAAEWEERRAAIVEVEPAVEDGDAIVGLSTEHYDHRIDASEALIEDLREIALEPEVDDIQLHLAVEELFSGIRNTGTDAPFPFTQIEDQQVVDALLADETCGEFLEERGW